MADFQNILAVMQDNAEAPRLLNKLHRLAGSQQCDISVIRVVYGRACRSQEQTC